jgi:multiple sugar transport system permease protein
VNTFGRSEARLAYVILFPVLGLLFVIATFPLVVALVRSFQSRSGEFAGFGNYAFAVSNPLFAESLTATAIYSLIAIPSEVLLGLAFAVLVHRSIRNALLRAIIYVLAILPIVIPPIATGVIWRLILAPDYGVLNLILIKLNLIANEIPWLLRPEPAMLSVAMVDIWQWTPFVFLIFFSGLQAVPAETVDAARVDGASGWALFWFIELPYLRALFTLVLFIRIADVLRTFDQVFVLTGGGPGSTTELLSLHLYRVAFKLFNSGQAAALAVMVLVSLGVLFALVVRMLPTEVER